MAIPPDAAPSKDPEEPKEGGAASCMLMLAFIVLVPVLLFQI